MSGREVAARVTGGYVFKSATDADTMARVWEEG
jgi:hypothetical protein